MATTTKPTLLIVHGGWHVPASYNKLTTALRDAGFEVHLPRHPSMNESRPPNADLNTDSDQIRAYASSLVEAGRSVAVLMHSYGGQVGTNALYGLSAKGRATKGLPGGITHLIYMTANALPQGKSMVDLVADFGHMDRMPVAFDFAEDKSVTPNYPKEGLVGDTYVGRVAPEEAQAYFDSFVRWNGESMYQPIAGTPAWKDDVKIGYIYTTGDLTIPIDYQKHMVANLEKEGKKVETVELDSGHAPNLTATTEVVDAVIKFTSA